MGKRKSPNGQRCRYALDDGTSWNIFEAQAKMIELHKEPVSVSLMQQRLTHSTDPEYVFLKKQSEWKKDGGHVYSKKNVARKTGRVAKVAPKLTAEEKAMQKALKSLGIAWI